MSFLMFKMKIIQNLIELLISEYNFIVYQSYHMKQNNATKNSAVHSFLEMSVMKFRPSNAPSIQTKLKEKKGEQSKIKKSTSQIEEQILPERLNFLEKLSPQHFLIGNEKQLDLILLGSGTKFNADIESIWTFNISKPIHLICIDTKKKIMAIKSNRQLLIYKYQLSKGSSPSHFKTIEVVQNLKFIQFSKDNHLSCFFQDKIMVYVINEDGYRITCNYKLNLSEGFTLYKVPSAFEGTVNIFFIENNQRLKVTNLWCMEMNVMTVDIKFQPLVHIYKIMPYTTIQNFQNYSKEIFLMNISDSEIFAFKRGYIIDNVNVNIKNFNSVLKYIPNERMVHINDKVVQIYNFNIDKNAKPNKIKLQATDSIEINKPENSTLLGFHEAGNGNYVIFYQSKAKKSIKVGEVTYWIGLTHQVKLDEKIQKLFPLAKMNELKKKKNYEKLIEKVDMAQKMGLSSKQIYLDLWNRTDRSQEEDYVLLLATKNYQLVKSQVQRKLKKSAMRVKQIIKIQNSCLQILESNVFGNNCNLQILKEYMSSHFFIRKLQLFKDISLFQMSATVDNQYFMNIQQYNKYEQYDIRALLLDYVSALCFSNSEVTTQIRLVLKAFRFTFIINYQNLLFHIVNTAKDELLKILQKIPELLPFNKGPDTQILEQGVWSKIKPQQWKNNLYIESVVNIDNRSIVQQLTNNIWFKRNQFFKHDFAQKKKGEINLIHQSIKSSRIFYIFIAYVFEIIKDSSKLKEIVDFMQRKYTQIPQNIKGKIFLYDKLYGYLECRNLLPKNYTKFYQFLQLKDYQLFQHFFIQERIENGIILKNIKPIYEGIPPSSQEQSCQASFNSGLLNYFTSDLSSVSDLKYILNRINNQKKEFHDANSEMYGVIVKAILKKLTVGTGNDIPFDQVLVYVEGIPFEKQNGTDDLMFILQTRSQFQKLNQMNLNMTVEQIKNESENVIGKMVEYQIQIMGLFQSVDNWDSFLKKTYEILARVQVQKQNLFSTINHDLLYLIYLCKILQDHRRVPLVIKLLQDTYLAENFKFDCEVIQSIVGMMYEWKLNSKQYYVDNKQYFDALFSLLPEDNQLRRYLECEVKIASLLSIQEKVSYPFLSSQGDNPFIYTISDLINLMSAQQLKKLQIKQIYNTVSEMETIRYGNLKDSEISQENTDPIQSKITPQKMISLHQLYQIVLLRLYSLGKHHQALPILKELLQIQVSDSRCNIVYVLIFTINIANEMNIQCLKELLNCISYYFFQPLELYRIIENIITQQYSNSQRKRYLQTKVKEGQSLSKGYSSSNFLFSEPVLEMINNSNLKYDFFSIIENVTNHLVMAKEQFQKNVVYPIIVKILCCQPYVFAKYLQIKKQTVNWRSVRSFLSFIIKEEIFNPKHVLEFGKRLFVILIKSQVQKIPIQIIISQFVQKSPSDEIPDFTDEVIKKVDKKIYKNITAFKKKKQQLERQENHKAEKQQKSQKNNLQMIEKLASDHGVSREPSQYPFNDSDNEFGPDDIPEQVSIKKKQRKKPMFNQTAEINKISTKKLKFNTQTRNISNFASMNLANSMRAQIGDPKNQGIGGSTNLQLQFNSTKLNTLQQKIKKQHQPQTLDTHNVAKFYRSLNTKSALPIKTSIQMDKNAVQGEHEKEDRGILQKDTHEIQKQLIKNNVIDSTQVNSIRFISNSKQQQKLKIIQTPVKLSRFQSELLQQNIVPQNICIQVEYQLFAKNQEYLTQPVSSNKNIVPNFEAFTALKMYDNYVDIVKKSLKILYNRKDTLFAKLLSFITEFNKIEPNLKVKTKWVDIYLRAQDLHEKYSLDLPIREVFPIEGLYFEGTTTDQLYHEIKPQIISSLNEMNVYKMLKVIGLAFRNSKLEQDVIFNYLKSMMNNQINSNTEDLKQAQMIHQKIAVIVQKIKPQILQERVEELFEGNLNSANKNQFLEMVGNSVKRRGSQTVVNLMQKKLMSLIKK